MIEIDEKVFQYTLDFSRQAELGTDEVVLKEAIFRHMHSARNVVTIPTLERIGHVHLSILINTSVRYNLSLGEVLMEAVRVGCQPASSVCAALAAKKTSVKRVSKRPTLRIV